MKKEDIKIGNFYWTHPEQRGREKIDLDSRTNRVKIIRWEKNPPNVWVAGMECTTGPKWLVEDEQRKRFYRSSDRLSEENQKEIDAARAAWSERENKLRWVSSHAGTDSKSWERAEKKARELGLGELDDLDRAELIRRGLPAPEKIPELQAKEAWWDRRQVLIRIADKVRFWENPWEGADSMAQEMGLGKLEKRDDVELITLGLPGNN